MKPSLRGTGGERVLGGPFERSFLETADTAPPPADPLVGRTIAGKYTLERLVGEGGMAAVYMARHITLEKTIALKLMHSEFAADPRFVARFTMCYRASASPSLPEGSWTLRLATADTGHIQESFLEGPLPEGVKSCISVALRGAMVHADTGAASASVLLSFRLH